MPAPELILASQSPRRKELLAEAGYRVRVIPPSCPDEPPILPGESPGEYVARLALGKARDAARQIHRGLLLACDTVAELDGQILGKPADRDDARRILRTLRGREHRVLTALCLWEYPEGQPRVEVAETRLRMEPLSDAQIEEYLASGLWEGKAGAFGYQDRLGWLRIVEGSESNVVGLPLELLAAMLATMRRPNDGSGHREGASNRL